MTSVAFASDGNNGNGATTINFNASYGWGALGGTGNWHCQETRIVKTDPKAFIKDSATCLVTGSGFTAGTYPAVGTWYSDYEYFYGGGVVRTPISGNITITDNGDGTWTWDVTAYYAP